MMLILAINLLLPSGIGVIVNDIPINSSKIVLILSVLLIVTIILKRKKISLSPYGVDCWVILFLFGIIVCSFVTGIIYTPKSVTFSLFLNTSAWCVAYFAIYYLGRLMPTNEYQISWLLKRVLNYLIIGAIIGIFEFILKINFYGEVAKLIGLNDNAGVGGMLYRDNQVRARSAFDQSIAFGFAMVVGYLLNERLSMKVKLFQHNIIKGIFIVALLVSFSRSAIAAFFVNWLYINYSKSGIITKIGTLIIFCFCAILISIQLDKIFYYDTSIDAGDGNLLVRFRDFDFAIDVFDFSPWFGIGTGVLHNPKYFESIYPNLFSLYDGALDNMVLSILVESGLVGLLLYLGLIFGVFRMATKITNDYEKRYLVGLGLVLLIASLSYDLFIFPNFGRLLLLLIAFSISMSQMRKTNIMSTKNVN